MEKKAKSSSTPESTHSKLSPEEKKKRYKSPAKSEVGTQSSEGEASEKSSLCSDKTKTEVKGKSSINGSEAPEGCKKEIKQKKAKKRKGKKGSSVDGKKHKKSKKKGKKAKKSGRKGKSKISTIDGSKTGNSKTEPSAL